METIKLIKIFDSFINSLPSKQLCLNLFCGTVLVCCSCSCCSVRVLEVAVVEHRVDGVAVEQTLDQQSLFVRSGRWREELLLLLLTVDTLSTPLRHSCRHCCGHVGLCRRFVRLPVSVQLDIASWRQQVIARGRRIAAQLEQVRQVAAAEESFLLSVYDGG